MSDDNDLQAYLEGDARQQDAAALRLDRSAVEAGQMSPAAFRKAWPQEPVPESPWTLPDVLRLSPSPVSYEPVPICYHPRAELEVHRSRPAYRRRREHGGRLRIRRTHGLPFHVLRCPDCRMWAGQVAVPGQVVAMRLPPVPLTTVTTTQRNRNADKEGPR